jgi:hypothetical protein
MICSRFLIKKYTPLQKRFAMMNSTEGCNQY